MPRKGSPYGPAHERARKRILTPGAVCHMCGAPATEADHDPPIKLHDHVNGSGCCRELPACRPCQAEQGFELGWGSKTPTAVVEVVELDDSPGADHAMWEVPWLFDLLEVPADATWPRYMSAPHPAAVDSYGAEAAEWLRVERGLVLRWWQRLALTRQLEHDEAGLLVWLEALLTTARQVGKSVDLDGGATWRLHQADRFGEPQLIMHTGKDLAVCKEVQRAARTWARARKYGAFEGNGNVQIIEPVSESRWLVRAQDGVYGYGVSNGIVDEAWAVSPGVVEDGLEPTMAERVSPQLVLASTAHSRATPLFPTRRLAALEQLAEPEATLLLEWSARRDADIEDRSAWRAASPHWSPGRERLLEKRVAAVRAGESVDPDESDPVESFRSQYLNIWPARTSSNAGSVLVEAEVWALCAEVIDTREARVFVAVEDNYGKGAAVAAAARGVDGRYEVDGWFVDSWADAFEDVAGIYATRERTQLTIGSALASDVDQGYRAAVATAADTRAGLALLRQMAATGQVVHDQAPDLEQLTTVRVREQSSGLTIVAG